MHNVGVERASKYSFIEKHLVASDEENVQLMVNNPPKKE